MNIKVQIHQGAILTKLLIFHLIIALKYQTRYYSNAKIKLLYLTGRFEKNLICIIMNLNENIRKETKIVEKLRIVHLQWSEVSYYDVFL